MDDVMLVTNIVIEIQERYMQFRQLCQLLHLDNILV